MGRFEAWNTKTVATKKWRFALVKEAIGIITLAEGQTVENKALARVLGQDPRALRQTLQMFPQIRCMIDPAGKRGLWYGINPDAPKLAIPGNVPAPAGAIAIQHKQQECLTLETE